MNLDFSLRLRLLFLLFFFTISSFSHPACADPSSTGSGLGTGAAGRNQTLAFQCPPGTYQSKPGKTVCNYCSTGYYRSNPGATSAHCDGPCLVGQYFRLSRLELDPQLVLRSIASATCLFRTQMPIQYQR